MRLDSETLKLESLTRLHGVFTQGGGGPGVAGEALNPGRASEIETVAACARRLTGSVPDGGLWYGLTEGECRNIPASRASIRWRNGTNSRRLLSICKHFWGVQHHRLYS